MAILKPQRMAWAKRFQDAPAHLFPEYLLGIYTDSHNGELSLCGRAWSGDAGLEPADKKDRKCKFCSRL